MRTLPRSTYRLQLNAAFPFAQASAILPYLRDLGVSHIYCSPYLQAAPGSMHGYDVVDPQQVNEELGGEAGQRSFSEQIKELGLGQILDIVPNHMAIGPQNRYWWDVLENGPSSRYASWFDIDWQSSEVKLQNKILLPVLGDQYGRVLSSGQIRIEQADGAFRVRYEDHLFPLAPRSLTTLLKKAGESLADATVGFLSDSLARLPAPDSTDPALIQERHRDKDVIYAMLQRLCSERPDVCTAVHTAIDAINADMDQLDTLLNLQNYRLAYWRTADQELGFRRFFDINTLIGLRMERQSVFDATHRRIVAWLQDGTLDGVRIDHPDGLRDPLQYFMRLRTYAPQAWMIAEKILEPGELLRSNWPIDGTSGYDFMNVCNELLVHPEGLREIGAIYNDFTGRTQNFEELAHDKKLLVAQEAMGSDVNRLTSLFVEICENRRDRRDYTRAEIRRAIREVAASFSIYRTYVIAERGEITDEDRAVISEAIAKAKQRRTDIDGDLFSFIGDVLSIVEGGTLEAEFVARFQQFTSPVMAKGVEDTTFYCFNRLVSLNEVGGAPDTNGLSVNQFHQYCARMQAAWPATMTALATHDTKRGEDVRARLAVLTELPSEWRKTLRRWARMHSSLHTLDRNTEYFLYQTLLGTWPISEDRLNAYMLKATREAKEQTSWTQNNEAFEKGLASFIHALLASQAFLTELEKQVALLDSAGRINSLTQTLLHYTAPGIPDTYQGSELWDFRLVDPDNRTPVDYAQRQSMLDELKQGLSPETIMQRAASGLPKLWLIHTALRL
ncbi:MAG TPA: malto-oligosyltrehalose synthase, partial [Acidobacteriaceae bacterium]|nr:malto-oligosyltrehalose synthase [Acidobacteriaceae bacterium]